jgi:hypothetical protein
MKTQKISKDLRASLSKDVEALNLLRALEQKKITWFEYFELLRKLIDRKDLI